MDSDDDLDCSIDSHLAPAAGVHPAAAPFVKDNGGKPRMSLLPQDVLDALIQVLEHGARKYGVRNWQESRNPVEDYGDAMYRHLGALRRGEVYDNGPGGTGQPHAACLMASAAFLTWFALHGEVTPAAPTLAFPKEPVAEPSITPEELESLRQEIQAAPEYNPVPPDWRLRFDEFLFGYMRRNPELNDWEPMRNGQLFHELVGGLVLVTFAKSTNLRERCMIRVEEDPERPAEEAKNAVDGLLRSLAPASLRHL